MKRVWDKLADIATVIFDIGFVVFVLGTFIVLIVYLIIDFGMCIWNWNKLVFTLYVLFLISGVIAGINWLIENLK